MIIIFFEKLKVKFIWWKLGLNTKQFKKMIENQKYMENHKPRSVFNLDNLRYFEYAPNN